MKTSTPGAGQAEGLVFSSQRCSFNVCVWGAAGAAGQLAEGLHVECTLPAVELRPSQVRAGVLGLRASERAPCMRRSEHRLCSQSPKARRR